MLFFSFLGVYLREVVERIDEVMQTESEAGSGFRSPMGLGFMFHQVGVCMYYS